MFNPKKYFHGKRVLVMGLGLHGGGVGMVKFLVKHGALVRVTDLRDKKELRESLEKLKNLKIKYVLGKHRKEDFENADLIIKNPAVSWSSPYLKIARKHKIPIDTDIGIFFNLCKAPIIGITGTKGKSTTASLLHKLLSRKYKNTILAGNIGVSPLEGLDKIKKNSFVILELSSWQLEGIALHRKSPQIALITCIFPDHLNKYKSFREYINSKKLIYKFQKKNDVLFLNFDDFRVRNFAKNTKAKLIYFSKKYDLSGGGRAGAYILKDWIVIGRDKRKIIPVKKIGLKGEHNLSNALGAVSITCYLRVPVKNIQKVLKSFQGIPSRIEKIKELKGVVFFNDTTATTPESTILALRTLARGEGNIILIAGGEDKKLKYTELVKEIIKHVKCVIIFPGTASEKLKKELREIKTFRNIIPAGTMKEAVKKAWRKSQKGDIILLSPAAASFNLFKHEFDRGKQFMEAVKALKL